MPRPSPPHPNPLVRARNRLACPPGQLAERLAIPLHALINAECGVPHKIPLQYFDHGLAELSDGHEYQAFRILRRSYHIKRYALGSPVVPSDGPEFKAFLDQRSWTPLFFSRKFCVPEVETYRAYLGFPLSVTLREVFNGYPRQDTKADNGSH